VTLLKQTQVVKSGGGEIQRNKNMETRASEYQDVVERAKALSEEIDQLVVDKAELKAKLDEAGNTLEELRGELSSMSHQLEHETDVRKNLQHVIVSQCGVDMISNCIKQIRESEASIGPLGPINDFRLAQLLSSTIALPAELKLKEVKKEFLREWELAESAAELFTDIAEGKCDAADEATKWLRHFDQVRQG